MPVIVAPVAASVPHEMDHAIILRAQANGFPSTTNHVLAVNQMAGVKGWPLVGALNLLAGNSTKNFRDLEGVLNQLAGTKAWGHNAAASRWAGLF